MNKTKLNQIRAFVDKNAGAEMIAMSRTGVVELLDYIDLLRGYFYKEQHVL